MKIHDIVSIHFSGTPENLEGIIVEINQHSNNSPPFFLVRFEDEEGNILDARFDIHPIDGRHYRQGDRAYWIAEAESSIKHRYALPQTLEPGAVVVVEGKSQILKNILPLETNPPQYRLEFIGDKKPLTLQAHEGVEVR